MKNKKLLIDDYVPVFDMCVGEPVKSKIKDNIWAWIICILATVILELVVYGGFCFTFWKAVNIDWVTVRCVFYVGSVGLPLMASLLVWSTVEEK